MKTPTINSRILKLEVLKGTATRTSVNAVESRTTSLEGDIATAQSNISTLQGDVATLTQGIADSVSTHNTAPAAHADIRTALAGKQDAGSFAGSSTPGGAATTSLACTGNAATATTAASCTGNSATATTASSCSGNAATATTLATARTLTIGSKANTFDGSADKAWSLAEIGAIDGAQTSFTPTVNFETPSAGMALSVINASSSRAGAVVFVRVALVISDKGTGGAGALIISGLPEEVKALPAFGIYLGVAWYNGVNTYSGAIGTDSIYVNKQFSAVSNGDYAQICITYERA